MAYLADRRLYVTEDGRMVEAGDPDARWLLVGAGSELSDAVAAKYGLTLSAVIEPESKPEAEAPTSDASGWEPETETPPVEPEAPIVIKPESKRQRKPKQ